MFNPRNRADCSASRYVIDSWSGLCIKLTHNKKVNYPTFLYVYFVSPAEFNFGSVGHTVHEVADELSHSARAVLRMLGALPSFPHTFSVKRYLYVYVTRSSKYISTFLLKAVRL